MQYITHFYYSESLAEWTTIQTSLGSSITSSTIKELLQSSFHLIFFPSSFSDIHFSSEYIFNIFSPLSTNILRSWVLLTTNSEKACLVLKKKSSPWRPKAGSLASPNLTSAWSSVAQGSTPSLPLLTFLLISMCCFLHLFWDTVIYSCSYFATDKLSSF